MTRDLPTTTALLMVAKMIPVEEVTVKESMKRKPTVFFSQLT